MEKIQTAIIGGGAAGLFLANLLTDGKGVVLFERGERLGRKLSATGNGQGNVTHLRASSKEYFSSTANAERLDGVLRAFDDRATTDFFHARGLLCTADERGRVYPAARQASALTDILRFGAAGKGVEIRLQTKILKITKTKDGFLLKAVGEKGEYEFFAKTVVLCAGGKAAKNFGTDGNGYDLAKSLGHRVTPLFPSLVQLKTDTDKIKSFKGIRINDGAVTAFYQNAPLQTVRGDIIFTDYGVSGDAVFRLSAFLADKTESGALSLTLDFLPDLTEQEILQAIQAKRTFLPKLETEELLGGTVNNQIGRAILRRAGEDFAQAARLVKNFPLTVRGSLGFDYAQVTKGGVAMNETDENLQSRLAEGLYFAGEILDVDGQCGGYNLQWAFSSASLVAQALNTKRGGQVCV